VIKNGSSDALISQVDLLASFAKLLNQSLPNGDAEDSKSLLNTLLGKTKKGRESVVLQGGALSIVKDNWKYIEPGKGPGLYKEVDIESGYDAEPQLYNLTDDIGERNNLSEKFPDKVKELSGLLQAIKEQNKIIR
jgi:arylsulfatase A